MQISNPTSTTYWIVSNSNNYTYGITEPNHTTSIGPMFTQHLLTTDRQTFIDELLSLNLITEDEELDF